MLERPRLEGGAACAGQRAVAPAGAKEQTMPALGPIRARPAADVPKRAQAVEVLAHSNGVPVVLPQPRSPTERSRARRDLAAWSDRGSSRLLGVRLAAQRTTKTPTSRMPLGQAARKRALEERARSVTCRCQENILVAHMVQPGPLQCEHRRPISERMSLTEQAKTMKDRSTSKSTPATRTSIQTAAFN